VNPDVVIAANPVGWTVAENGVASAMSSVSLLAMAEWVAWIGTSLAAST
jgi:hypothetical protein